MKVEATQWDKEHTPVNAATEKLIDADNRPLNLYMPDLTIELIQRHTINS